MTDEKSTTSSASMSDFEYINATPKFFDTRNGRTDTCLTFLILVKAASEPFQAFA